MPARSIWTGSLAVAHSKGSYFPPIFSLPIELLEIVFIHGARTYYEKQDILSFGHCLPTWVNVSYVCRHWRNIALNCSSLWTYHFNLSPRWTEELLHRSRQASLKVFSGCLHFPTPNFVTILDNLLRHSERIQELRLDLVAECIPAKFTLRAPRLETLEIKVLEPLEEDLEITDVDTPILRTIELFNCALPWHAFNLGRLSTLAMDGSYTISSVNSTEFLVALGNMPNLRVLQLNRGLPRDFLSSDPSNKVDLPRLVMLSVTDSLHNIVTLLSCLDIPLKTQLSLRLLPPFDIAVEDYAPLSSILALRFNTAQRASGPIFRSLTLLICSVTTLMWSTLERDCRRLPDLDEDLDTPHAPLQITWNTWDMHGVENPFQRSVRVHPFVAHMCTALPMANVQTLYVHWDEFPCQFSCWGEMLGGLGGLRYLMLEGSEMQDLSVLSRDGDGRVVPALEELKLVRMYFPSEEHAAESGGMSHKSFMEMLSTRKRLWDRVTLTDCKFGT